MTTDSQTNEPTEAQVDVAAKAMDENFNPDKYPIMAAMFRDYAEVALAAADAIQSKAKSSQNFALPTVEMIAELREVAKGSVQGTQVIGSPIMRGGELAARAADALEAMTRERDAALAAIERVRAIHEFDDGYCKSCEIPFHECDIATALVEALDGAPESEEKS